MLKGDVVGPAAIRVIDRDHSMVSLGQRYGMIGTGSPIDDQTCPTVDHMAIRRVIGEAEARILPDVVQIDGISPVGAAVDCNVSGMRSDEERVVVIGYCQIEALAD